MVVFRAKCGQSGNLTEGISCVGYICVVVFAVFVRRGGGVGVGVVLALLVVLVLVLVALLVMVVVLLLLLLLLLLRAHCAVVNCFPSLPSLFADATLPLDSCAHVLGTICPELDLNRFFSSKKGSHTSDR